jgi:RNA polymerase sigma-70 factor (ECF subfamily)
MMVPVGHPHTILAQQAAEETRLMARVARGESAALKHLYERHAARLLALAHRIIGARGEAEEVVQESFLEVWRRAKDFSTERGSVTTFVNTIVRSRAIDRLRSRGARERVTEAAKNEPPRDSASPLEAVEQRVERERINAALMALPAEQRQVLELAYFEGLSQSEIAEKTGEPLGTVKTRVRLAMGKLAALLGGGNP